MHGPLDPVASDATLYKFCSDAIPEMPTHSNTRIYKLRPMNQRFLQITSYLDEDKSGNFDPEKLYSTQSRKRIKGGARFSNSSLLRVATSREPSVKLQRKTHKRPRTTIVLKIDKRKWETPRGKEVAKLLVSSGDYWPTVGDGSTLEAPGNFTDLSVSAIVPHRLRNRNNTPSSNTISTLRYEGLDPEKPSWRDVCNGHPAARGCKACFELGMRCGLIDGERYPCSYCRSETEECALISEPKTKRPCESCLSRRLCCSFQRTSNHSGACEECQARSYSCIAGPLNGYTRDGPSMNMNFGRGSVGRPGGLKAHPDPAGGDKYRAYDFKQLGDTQLPAGLYGCNQTHEPRPESPQDTFIDNSHQQRFDASMLKIGYSYSIHFFYEPSEGRSDVCNWCEDIAYGLVGAPGSVVGTVSHKFDKEYLKTDENFESKIQKASRMCVECTLSRIRIIGCSGHRLVPLPCSPGDLPESIVRQWQGLGMASHAPFRWCQVCPQPSQYSCGLTDSNPENASRKGCGLELCQKCAIDLVLFCESNLSQLLDLRLKDHRKIKDMRADAALLSEHGYLVKCLK